VPLNADGRYQWRRACFQQQPSTRGYKTALDREEKILYQLG
jgi:hypothetical protein